MVGYGVIKNAQSSIKPSNLMIVRLVAYSTDILAEASAAGTFSTPSALSCRWVPLPFVCVGKGHKRRGTDPLDDNPTCQPYQLFVLYLIVSMHDIRHLREENRKEI